MGCLYKISASNGKEYIGITMKLPDVRLLEHIKYSKRKATSLHRSMQKYGVDKFYIRTLVVANDWEYLCLLEQSAIKAFKTKVPFGYNMTDGGDGVRGMSEESKEIHRTKTSKGTKESWGRDDVRAAHAAARARPEYKKRQADATKYSALWSRADYREKTIASRSSIEARAKVALSVSNLWKNADYRKLQIEKRKEQLPRSEESKTRQSEKMKEVWRERKLINLKNFKELK